MIVKPSYKKSIVNLMASINSYYGGVSQYETLHEVDLELKKEYKHIFLLIFDGMGYKNLEKLPESTDFLRKNALFSMESVFPPTTTAAMTSYYTGLAPIEHGWLGWSLYFKECANHIDLFTNRCSYTGQPYNQERIAYEILSYTSIYEKLKKADPELSVYTIKPSDIYFPCGPNVHMGVDSLQEMRDKIIEISKEDKKTFTAAYWPEPDMTMHEFGPTDQRVSIQLKGINDWIENLAGSLSETLLIVSADHGQTEIKEEIMINEHPELMACLFMPPSLEGRATTFRVKPEAHERFRSYFNHHFKDKFMLYSKKEVIDNKLFGHFGPHPKPDDFLGDYLACALDDAIFLYKALGGSEPHHFKGHHAGLTDEEMLIPLILVPCY